jgi:hypothetical protein
MNRRDFLATGMATVVASAAASGETATTKPSNESAPAPGADGAALHPRDIKLRVKPVMTNIIHSAVWEGPCRWDSVKPEIEQANAEGAFASWSKQLKTTGLGRSGDVELLQPAHLTFSEDFVLAPEQLAKLAADSQRTDAYFIIPAGSSISAYEIGKAFGKPIVFEGLGCRNVDIAAYARSKGNEAFVAADAADLVKLLSLLRARKVFRQTSILFPTDRGLPASCAISGVWDLESLHKRLGVAVKTIAYRELAEEMNRRLGDQVAGREAERDAAELLRKADRSFIDKNYVLRALHFDRAVRNLMARHECNAFTIECFEFCSSKLPQQWLVTPCLLHALFGNEGIASSCEADLGSLLAVRLLMSVSGKSCHQGNSDPKSPDTFRINHSAPSMKMNGLDQPDLPYQLGRFVQQGWGAKAVIDFMNNHEKTVTVARIDPTATKLLVLKGTLVGASGWGQDLLGCSVEAVIKPPEGRTDEFLRARVIYGNHLPWVYGDYTSELATLGEMLGLGVQVIC